MNKVLITGEVVKLNLGCGNKIWPGFINVDLMTSAEPPDVVSDLRSLPFPDDYADEAHAIHVLEHFYLWDVPDLLLEWKRVLKPGGKLVVEVPCMDKILVLFSKPPVILQETFLGLYGDFASKDPNMIHKWCYSRLHLKSALRHAGFRDVVAMEPEHHLKHRDIRVEGIK